jgi:hypothetical protein
MTTTPWPLEFDVDEEQGQQWRLREESGHPTTV